jgi:hypothetical protein
MSLEILSTLDVNCVISHILCPLDGGVSRFCVRLRCLNEVVLCNSMYGQIFL